MNRRLIGQCGWALALVTGLCAGCRPTAPAPQRQPGASAAGRAERSNTLLNAAATQLGDLPTFVNTELRRPSVILDARRSPEGKDIVAVCVPQSEDPNSPINALIVPAQNGHFRSLRVPVQPGDVVKFYIREDEDLDEDRRLQMQQSGMERLLPVDLTVAQVINENVLVVEGGLDDAKLAGKPGKIEIIRYLDDRMVDVNERLVVYATRRLPPLGWEPGPDEAAIKQIVDRLNQWARQSEPMSEWKLDPLLATLDATDKDDKELAPRLASAKLSALEFEPHSGRLLQEAIWIRDISRWAPGDRFDDLGRAEKLFDWTVRNIQLEADDKRAAHRPWQVLLYGRGTAEQRAWVFALLCRQQGLDVVMLSPGAPAARAAADGQSPTTANDFSLPAVLVSGQLHVFDPRLGLPIPGSGGKGVATLEQLRSDDSLLRHLDLADAKYPLTSADFQQVTAMVVADPFELSLAAFQLERRLPRNSRVVLSADASAIANRVKSLSGVAGVRLWPLPFRTLREQLNRLGPARNAEALAFRTFAWRPFLWKARVLQFHGRKRTADEKGRAAAEDVRDDHAEATELYRSPDVRPSAREVSRSTPEKRQIDTASQLNAAYWLGGLLFDDGKLEVAQQWLSRPELLEASSPWASGARYSLARTLEAQGKVDEAIALCMKRVTHPSSTATACAPSGCRRGRAAGSNDVARPNAAGESKRQEFGYTISRMLSFIRSRWFLFSLISVLVVGMVGWRPLEPLTERISKNAVVAAIMVLMSLPMETAAMWRVVRRPGAAWLGSAINLGLAPILGWLAGRLLPIEFAVGLIAATVTPCTLAAATVWTRRAGGNDAVAILVTVITNLFCFLAIPAWLRIFLGPSSDTGVSLDYTQLALQLVLLVVAPLVAGQAFRQWKPIGDFVGRRKTALAVLAQLCILTFVLTGAVRCGREIHLAGPDALSAGSTTLMLVLVVVIHVALLWIGFRAARVFALGHADAIAVGIAGSQKTITVGLFLALELATQFGAMVILPMVAYHAAQLIIDTILADRLRDRKPAAVAVA